MSSLMRVSIGEGFTPILEGGRGKAGLTFGVLRLKEGGRDNQSPRLGQPVFEGNSRENEVGLVILSGRCVVETAGITWGPIGERNTVFSGKATAVYIPPHTDYCIYPVGEVEIATSGVRSDAGGEPQIVTPDEVVVHARGTDHFKREVHDIIASNVKAEKLVVGETFTLPGNWSSYPPHKHDMDDFPNEVKMEELYFFRVQPKQGFGIQVIYRSSGGSREEAYLIKDGDVVLIEDGYHPVAAPPGYALYYLWVLSGETRMLIPRTDPDHAWVEERKE